MNSTLAFLDRFQPSRPDLLISKRKGLRQQQNEIVTRIQRVDMLDLASLLDVHRLPIWVVDLLDSVGMTPIDPKSALAAYRRKLIHQYQVTMDLRRAFADPKRAIKQLELQIDKVKTLGFSIFGNPQQAIIDLKRYQRALKKTRAVRQVLRRDLLPLRPLKVAVIRLPRFREHHAPSNNRGTTRSTAPPGSSTGGEAGPSSGSGDDPGPRPSLTSARANAPTHIPGLRRDLVSSETAGHVFAVAHSPWAHARSCPSAGNQNHKPINQEVTP